MEFKFFRLIVLLCINFAKINGQSEILSCEYKIDSYFGYTCDLTIINPNGLNNFRDINGKHNVNKLDGDVESVIFNSTSNTSNIPAIICEKFRNLKNIRIIINGLTEIHDYSLANCKNLEGFFIESYNLKKVYKNAFSKNLQLKYLEISGSEILSSFPANTFPNTGNKLTSLDLSSNKINILKPEWFQNLSNLTSLNLYNNEIEELPINIFSSLKNLKNFNIGLNKLKVFSTKSFFDISKFEYYVFHNNPINAIDENFFKIIPFDPSKFYDILCAPRHYNSIKAFVTCFENYRAWEKGNI